MPGFRHRVHQIRRTLVVPRLVPGIPCQALEGRESMMLRFVRIASLATFVCAALLAGPASADPANKNANVLTFNCTRGSETMSFQAVAILQNASIAGHLLDGTRTIVFKHVEVGGQVIFDAPGQAGRSDLWTCSIVELPDAVVTAFITPRH